MLARRPERFDQLSRVDSMVALLSQLVEDLTTAKAEQPIVETRPTSVRVRRTHHLCPFELA